MKIAYITPGSGGSFYCQNCFRDDDLLTSLLLLGHDVRKVPMYLPSNLNHQGQAGDIPVFYGAINVYLKEKFPAFRRAPNWLGKFLDSQTMLRMAAKKSGSTRATGLEGMTVSMLQGESGRHAAELDNLIKYLGNEIKPDIVHLSNALLLGLAFRIKNDLKTKIVCSLQDENEWIDEMSGENQTVVWGLMADKTKAVDLFISTSQYYAERSQKVLQIPMNKIKVIHGGINLDGYQRSSLPLDPPVIGYLCRMSEYFGLGIVVDAFIELKKKNRFKDLRLHITGGYTADDKNFVNSMIQKMIDHGYGKDFEIFKDFDKKNRVEFLQSLTLLSVPVPSGEAFGAYQVEALAAGVPVVQPNVGCYPEFLEATHGGIIYEPNTGKQLADSVSSLLADPERLGKLAEQGSKAVYSGYSMKRMALDIVDVYKSLDSQGE